MPGILCEHCTAACCNYIALPIDEPETHAEFEDLRWFLIHEHVSVFVEDGSWFIAFQTRCRHLRDDHLCGIYDTRPQICRDYSTENCDYHSGDYGWEQHFTAPEHLDSYIRTHGPQDARKGAAARAKLNGHSTARNARPGAHRKSGDRQVENGDESGPQRRRGRKVPRRLLMPPAQFAPNTQTDRRGVPLPVLPSREG
ncbi:MAG: YkgJ family cysteine cluster protein [Phycisphaerales bacterium]|nr:YkgJ family cysteine cluster protein [Phycisphaerales bacterium]